MCVISRNGKFELTIFYSFSFLLLQLRSISFLHLNHHHHHILSLCLKIDTMQRTSYFLDGHFGLFLPDYNDDTSIMMWCRTTKYGDPRCCYSENHDDDGTKPSLCYSSSPWNDFTYYCLNWFWWTTNKQRTNKIGTVSQLGVTIGLLLSQVLGLSGILGSADGWPFLLGVAFVPAVLQLMLLPMCPESPRYLLITKGRISEARQG